MRLRASGLARRAASIAEQEVAARARRAALAETTVFLESFGGNGMLCNPEAIFRALLAADDLSALNFVWALSAKAWSDPARAEFADDPRVRFVRRRSPGYYRALGAARYLVNNATFPHAFAKRAGQVYLNTWHGTPLKTMGYEMPGGAAESVNIVRNLLTADYLLAPNEQTARMYLDAYRMRGIHRGALLRVGTPRIDRQFAGDTERARTTSRLRERGIEIDPAARVVLFAPTWRGSFARPDDDLDRLCADVSALAGGLGPNSRLLVKVHQRVYARARADARLTGRLMPNDLPTNDVLAITDVLVSDYSSILVDFLATGRRIAVYAPDVAQYESERGLTVEPGELPGRVCTRIEELIAHLNTADGAATEPAYASARDLFCPAEDGKATARVLDVVFRGLERAGEHVRRNASDGRRSLLIYAGGMQSNGVTSSALSLIERIDHTRFDVTVTYPASAGSQLAGTIDPRARVLPRLGGTTWTRVLNTPFPFVGGRLPFSARRLAANTRLADEWQRCFGDTRFDNVVDFGGYSAFFAKLLQAGTPRERSTWLHNDIRSEMESHDRSAWLRANLRRTTSMYPTSDHLVSVSPTLAAMNAAYFGNRVAAERFTFARNTVNADRVRELSRAPIPAGAGGREILPAAPGIRTFITVGRLSEAKNHLRLISAFADVHEKRPASRLVIVGAGPLRSALEEAARSAGVADVVAFTGAQPNPYALMAGADCFVLSSDYEGQPMVLLEALTLGLPIITTDFDSVSGALPAGNGLIVGRDVASLAAGMLAFLDGAVPVGPFDSDVYNREATEEFYRAIGETPSAT